MNTLILDTIAEALDRLRLTQHERAEVFHAWDAAPDADVRPSQYDDYFKSEAHAAWMRVRDIRLNGTEDWLKTTLEEAANYNSKPTKEDLLAALARAERMLTP